MVIQLSGTVDEIIAFGRMLELGRKAQLGEVSAEIDAALRAGEVISAVKIRRSTNDCGLKEAKDYVDVLIANNAAYASAVVAKREERGY